MTALIDGNGKRVLLAEGDPTWRIVLKGALVDGGYDVEVASHGLDCLAKLRQRSAKVLVLDMDIAWGGGDGILALMREDSDIPMIPVVLTCNAHTAWLVPHLIAFPVVRWLLKPVATEDFLGCVRDAANIVPRLPSPAKGKP